MPNNGRTGGKTATYHKDCQVPTARNAHSEPPPAAFPLGGGAQLREMSRTNHLRRAKHPAGVVIIRMTDGTGIKSQRLLNCTLFRSGIGYAGDEPLAAGLHQVEEVGSAVVRFAVHQKLEGRPDHGQVVIGAHQGIVNALFHMSFAGFRLTDFEREARPCSRMMFVIEIFSEPDWRRNACII